MAEFERHRPRLFGIAYGMLGSVEDAQEVLQEVYLRWHRADVAEVREVCAPGACVRVSGRFCVHERYGARVTMVPGLIDACGKLVAEGAAVQLKLPAVDVRSA